MKSINLLFILVLSLFAGNVYANRNIAVPVIKYDFTSFRAGNDMHIDLTADISQLQLHTQHMIVITPVIVSSQGEEIHTFESFIIAGRKRSKVLHRDMAFENGDMDPSLKEISTLIPLTGKKEKITLNYTLPVQPELYGARMICRKKIYVCTCSMFSDNISTLPETILPLFREPAYRISIIVPPGEPVKERAETYTARLNFEVAKYDLLYNYKNNAQVLNEVGAIISEIKNDPDLTITQFRIAGYASPEGNFNSNMKLSENRARAFAAYLKSHFHITEDQLSIEWFGEDWQGLYEVIKASYLPEKENIMRLIDNGYDNAELKRKLQTLSGGTIYRTLLHDYYPSLRRNEYTISYIARSFDLEEARELIKTKPHYLSLNEMFLVSNSYSPDSKEFREVFDITLKVFPESPVAILNVAAIHIENSEYKQAIEKLQQLETPEAYNNLGVIYAKQQMYEQAETYFREAAKKMKQMRYTISDNIRSGKLYTVKK